MTATTATRNISNGVDKTEAIIPVGTKGRKVKTYFNSTPNQMRKDLIRYYCGFKHGHLRTKFRAALTEKKIDCVDWSMFRVVHKRELVAMLTTLELTKMVVLPERIYNQAVDYYSRLNLDSDLVDKASHSILYYRNTLLSAYDNSYNEQLKARLSAISSFDDAQIKAITEDCWYIYAQGEAIEAENPKAPWNDTAQQARGNQLIRQRKLRAKAKAKTKVKNFTSELKTLALHALRTSEPDDLPFRAAIKILQETKGTE